MRVPASGGPAVTVGQHPGAVQPGRPRVRPPRRAVRHRRRRRARSTACARARRARRPRRCSPPASRAPTASRSTSAATSGSPTAGPARAACGGSATTARRVRCSASSRWSTTSTSTRPGVGGIGRDPRSAPPATVTITPTGRQAANTPGSQHIVANGLAFDRDGSLFIGDTARGAIWRVDLDRRGNLRSPTGCDTTFTAEHAVPRQRVRAAPVRSRASTASRSTARAT